MGGPNPKQGGYPIDIEHPFPFELSADNIVNAFHLELNNRLTSWQSRLISQPGSFSAIEQEVISFSQLTSQWITASLLSSQPVLASISKEAETIFNTASEPLRKVGSRKHKLRLLCGLVLMVSCQYCVPRKEPTRGRKKSIGKRGKAGVGLYLEKAALGIQDGVSPGLQSEVARHVVLLPSIELAREELKRKGNRLDEKTVHAILLATAMAALAWRREELERWRAGEIVPTTALKNKRVVVSIDGGRARMRKPRKGKRKKSGRFGFATPWQEPKLLIIYVIGDDGKKDRTELEIVDGTFLGPDHLMELVAFHLYRLGAQLSEKVLFIADGADWIWDRVPIVAHKVGLKRKQWDAAVDLFHVMAQINKALETVPSWDAARLKRERRKIKRWLLNGRIEQVLKYLRKHHKTGSSEVFEGRLFYLEKRKFMMCYHQLRRAHWPIGSGAIESAIRRVINLRMKSPGTFWLEENAEGILYLRAQALIGRWDMLMNNLQMRARTTRSREWKWETTPMSCLDTENTQLVDKHRLAVLNK